jgi:RNA polymerase subunit RPABC4/transcription elongation factor Spt4
VLRWRKMTWAFWIVNAIFLILALVVSRDRVELVVTLWIAAFVVLGLAWMVTRRRRSACPVCGGDRRRATTCPNCGTGALADEVDEAALITTTSQYGDSGWH